MRERKVVKFNVNMYDDTKFKIIDMKPERDLIHYVWTRFVTLAGKVNLEGDLYMSKNIPYTIETLAIEFNRGIDQIKLALDVLMELEIIEINDDNVYRVKNFAKHQNIKVKEKIKAEDKEISIKDEKVKEEENSKNEVYVKEEEKLENKINQNESENIKTVEVFNLEINNKDINKIDDNITNEKVKKSQKNVPILLDVKKSKRENKKKKNEITFEFTDEETENNQINGIHDEEIYLSKDDSITSQWSFA